MSCKRQNCHVKYTLGWYQKRYADGCLSDRLPIEQHHYHMQLGCGCEFVPPPFAGPDWMPREHYCEQDYAGAAIAEAVKVLI
jgi:hypothetical protein